MNCKLVFLKEQKYMGIKTRIFYKDHDNIDFVKLQLDVMNADIPNRDDSDRFLAMDSDYMEDSFGYTPLVPVTAFEGEEYCRFTRVAGEYYCFEVALEELGPKWFEKCNAYMAQNNIKVDRAFDIEYYPEGYISKMLSGSSDDPLKTIELIFRKVD